MSCQHTKGLHGKEPRTPDGCEECLATGGRWVHLRLCLECGHVGCCDDSPNTHATNHARATGIRRSRRPSRVNGGCTAIRTMYLSNIEDGMWIRNDDSRPEQSGCHCKSNPELRSG